MQAFRRRPPSPAACRLSCLAACRTLVLLASAWLVATPEPATAQTLDPKAGVIEALGGLGVALDGAFGDEGPTVASSLDALAQGIRQWEALIQGYEGAIAAERSGADAATAARMQTAIGGVYLDRGRQADALRAFDAALRMDPARLDAMALAATVHAATPAGRSTAAALLARALAADPTSAARAYQLARLRLTLGDRAGASGPLSQLLDAVAASPRPEAPDPSPFLQLGLVAERPGIEPFFPPVLYAAGFDLLRQGRLDEAVASFRKAAAQDPLTKAGLEAGALRRAADAFRSGLDDDAVRALQTAIELAPDRSEPHRVLGLVLLTKGQAGAAVDALRTAVRLDAADERARLALADALVAAGQLEEAARSLRETLARLPGSGRAQYRLGLVHQRQVDYPKAIAAFDAAVRFSPLLGFNSLYQTIGALRRQQQDYAGAIDAFEHRIALVPNDAAAHHELADMYYRQSRHDDALAEYAVALLLDPARVTARVGIAQIQLREGRFAEAAAAARAAVAADARQKEARYVLGTALLRMGQADAGRAELAVFQQLQDEAADARTHEFAVAAWRREADVHLANGEHAQAVALLRRVVESEPRAPTGHFALGVALLGAGSAAEAITHLEVAASTGGPIDAHRYLADALEGAGRVDEARAHRTEYARLRREALRAGALP